MPLFPQPRCPQRPARHSRSLLLMASMAAALPAKAMEGYAQNVKDACAIAGRPVPDFSVDDCNICHQNANNKRAYQSGDFLDVFCPIPANNGTANTAPVLERQASPQTVKLGRAFRLTLAATDAQDDFLAFTAKGLPAGAKLGKTVKSQGKWTAPMTWTPQKAQAGKTFTAQFTVTETRRSPKLSATQKVAFFVSASAAPRGLAILQSRYASGTLAISGTATGAPAAIEVQRDDGAFLGTARVTDQGSWQLALPLAEDQVPCVVHIAVEGEPLALEPVKSTEAGCR